MFPRLSVSTSVPVVLAAVGRIRADLDAGLHERREASLRERGRLSARSVVPALDALLDTFAVVGACRMA